MQYVKLLMAVYRSENIAILLPIEFPRFSLEKILDSAHTFKVLAVQFDNRFISEGAIRNAKRMCKVTGSNYYQLTMKKEVLYDTFRKAAESYDAFPSFG
jgi:tRNA(Ile)-lysidine synthase TilS/MesJ